MIEEVVVETVETTLLVVGEDAVLVSGLCGYPWMVMPFLCGVFDEQHVVEQSEERVLKKRIPLVSFLIGEKVEATFRCVSNSGRRR